MAKGFTLGVEQEFQIIGPETRSLSAGAGEMIERASEIGDRELQGELHDSMIEIATTVCSDVSMLRKEVCDDRLFVSKVAELCGRKIAAASTHPFSRWQDQALSPKPRYAQIVEDMQDVARANLIFGMHVHVGVEDPEESIAVFNSLRYFLPHMLALSTSSPFLEGRNTGMKSVRSAIFERMPRTGIPGSFRSHGEFQRCVNSMIKTGCIESGSRVWWDLRPHPEHPTLEFRVCDLPTRVDDVVAIAALAQALVARLAYLHRENLTWGIHRREFIQENKWRAMRYGVDGKLIDLRKQKQVPMSRLVHEMVAFVDPVLDELGSRQEVEHILRIAEVGTSADHQVRVWEDSGLDALAVVDHLTEETLMGVVS